MISNAIHNRLVTVLALSALACSTLVVAQDTGVITVQQSASVAVSASGAFTSITAACPTGYIALSGGVDSASPDDLRITSLKPAFGAGATELLAMADGAQPAPTGWPQRWSITARSRIRRCSQ